MHGFIFKQKRLNIIFTK